MKTWSPRTCSTTSSWLHTVSQTPHKVIFVSILLFHGKCDRNNGVHGSWYVARNDLNGYFFHASAIQLTTAIDHLDNKTTQSPCIMSMVWHKTACSDSIALAMELLQSCAKPSMSSGVHVGLSNGQKGQTENSFSLWINMKNIARP